MISYNIGYFTSLEQWKLQVISLPVEKKKNTPHAA